MKVKVIREMPFAKVGQEFTIDSDTSSLEIPTQQEISEYYKVMMHPSDIHYYPTAVKVLIRDGWVEEVKRGGLSEKQLKDILFSSDLTKEERLEAIIKAQEGLDE